MPSKTMIALAAATVLAAASAAPATAAQYCASYTSGGKNCGFHSTRQCETAVSGIGGFCSGTPDRRPGPIAQRQVPAAAFAHFASVRYPVRAFAKDAAEETRLDRAKGGIRY